MGEIIVDIKVDKRSWIRTKMWLELGPMTTTKTTPKDDLETIQEVMQNAT